MAKVEGYIALETVFAVTIELAGRIWLVFVAFALVTDKSLLTRRVAFIGIDVCVWLWNWWGVWGDNFDWFVGVEAADPPDTKLSDAAISVGTAGPARTCATLASARQLIAVLVVVALAVAMTSLHLASVFDTDEACFTGRTIVTVEFIFGARDGADTKHRNKEENKPCVWGEALLDSSQNRHFQSLFPLRGAFQNIHPYKNLFCLSNTGVTENTMRK